MPVWAAFRPARSLRRHSQWWAFGWRCESWWGENVQNQCAWYLVFLVLLAGCSRTHYRVKADADAYTLLQEKTYGAPWYLPSDFDIVPRPGSRLFDPTPIDDPLLPNPSPQLYAYTLPELSERDPSRFSPGGAFVPQDPLPGGPIPVHYQVATTRRLPPVTPIPMPPATATPLLALASHQFPPSRPSNARPAIFWNVSQAGQAMPNGPSSPLDAGMPDEGAAADRYRADAEADDVTGFRLLPIPEEFWVPIPKSSQTRMLEFESVIEEYRRTYDRDPSPEELDSAPRFTLEDIVEVALLNSREYQTQKEILYNAALRLSLERFAYDLKFSTGGNRTAANYFHNRIDGLDDNRVTVPSRAQVDKLLATGGSLLAQFANSVVLTFNGSKLEATDIASELFVDLEQSVFQRDIRFESLTQAERDVIYAARRFRRFRKTLFVGLAREYYQLLIDYRNIEIQSQNYFSLVREFQQRAEESRRGFVPLFQVDQVEQNVLTGRRSLIGQCVGLEQSLDNLKISMGIPTESPINLDLTELEGLTLRDELAVTGELIGRIRARLDAERTSAEPSRVQLLSSGIGLLDRILEAYDQQRTLGVATPDTRPLELQRLRMRIDAVRLEVDEDRRLLEDEQADGEPNVAIMLQRARDLIDGLSQLHTRQLEYVEKKLGEAAHLQQQARNAELQQEVDALDTTVQEIFASGQVGELLLLVDRMTMLLARFEEFAQQLDGLSGLDREPLTPQQALEETIAEASQLVQLIDEIRANVGGGLTPVKIDIDDAMLTGLVKRLDLITQRNEVADRWRQIKISADELKSALNLNASQTISTRAFVDRVNPALDFKIDESRTALSATLDLPLNRRAQRNVFRQQLINYQAALRNQMELEDVIKLAIRNDIRNLALDRERYAIDVAGAALAYEQVVTTELQLRLGVAGIFSRDFLDAQNGYASRLSNVASDHIGYILRRMQLFLDLELLDVNDDGFWPELYDEDHQPEGYYQLPPEALPAYGTLPHGLMFSKLMRRMEYVPPGTAMIHSDPHGSALPDLEPVPTDRSLDELPTPADPLPLVPVPPSDGAAWEGGAASGAAVPVGAAYGTDPRQPPPPVYVQP